MLFIGIAVDFGIQFSVRYRDERFRADDLVDGACAAPRAASAGRWRSPPPATAVGFFSFVPTDYTGVSDLGLIAGVGMLIALALNLTLLPALLTLLRPRGERAAGRLRPRSRRSTASLVERSARRARRSPALVGAGLPAR